MKIAIIGPYPIEKDTNNINGGVQAVVVNTIKGLSRFEDLNIHVITASPRLSKDTKYVSKNVTVHGVSLDRRLGNLTLYSNTRNRIIRKVREISPDIIHSHMLGYYTLAALDSGHEKILVSTHGVSNKGWGINYGAIETIRRAMQARIYEKCLKRTENFIVNSAYTKNHLSEFGKDNLYELDNPVSDIFFEPNGNKKENKRILFAGHICEEKGIMTLLCSLDLLRKSFEDIKLVIAGDSRDRRFYAKVLGFVNEKKMQRHISFLGHLNDYELKNEYDKASVFAFPSEQDVAPLAVLQAMASSKAIVAARVGGIPYIIDEGVNGLLTPKKDSRAFADSIAALIKDPGLSAKLSSGARNKACRINRISTVTDTLYKIYAELDSRGTL